MLRLIIPLLLYCLVGCGQPLASAPRTTVAATVVARPTRPEPRNLVEARSGFQSKFIARGGKRAPAPTPPQTLRVVGYPSPVGELTAYLTPDPGDGRKMPAIIWIKGGDCNSIGAVWDDPPEGNDQTARQFRREGVVVMYPSLRGGNQNPGQKEGFLGEVDDVLAARDFLAKQAHVDPQRIYLGGHSTGGTLALLVAEYSDKFRAVFSFGPVSDVSAYEVEHLPFDVRDPDELRVRSPIHWVSAIRTPTFVFEGARQSNVDSLVAISNVPNPQVKCFVLQAGTHLDILAPVNRVLAKKILADRSPTCQLDITIAELKR